MGLNFSNRARSVHAICTYTRSSMLIPACASTAFSPSSRFLISSSICSGAFPVFGSRPSRPAKYSVLPERIASLNGSCAGLSGRLMAFRVGCIVTCENAPCTVRIPATAKTTTRKLMRRFIFPSIRLTCRVSVIPRCAFGKPPKRCRPRKTAISVVSPNSFEFERDEPHANEVQRSEAHTQPQQPSEKKRPPPHPLQRSAGDSAADEEQCCSEAESSESEEPLGEMLERGEIGVQNRGENEEGDEPRELRAGPAAPTNGNVLGALVFGGRRGQCKRNDPQGAGKFYGGADYQGLGAVLCGRAHDGTRVVDCQCGPQSELRLRKVEGLSDRRKNEQGD